MSKMTPAAIRAALVSVPGWRKKGQSIVCRREFKNFVAAIQFVNAVARRAEKAQHHPDIDIRWNLVQLTLTTHDSGGLSERDFDLARAIDRL